MQVGALRKDLPYERSRTTWVKESIQGRSEGTSSEAFEVLIIHCHIEFVNLFNANYLMPIINLFIFNCLTSNFRFPKNISFASRRERLFMEARPQFRILNSPGEMMTCYLRETDIFFEVPHPVREYNNMRIPSKSYQTNTVCTF